MFYIVGVTETCQRLAVCRSAQEASKYIQTLPGFEDGRYYIDDCTETVVLDTPGSPLGEPPADLKDAWERFQHGGKVEPWEARKLDEWRADCAEAAGF